MTRRPLVAVLAVAALLLGGCASIPTTGPVREGSGEVSDSNPFVPFAEGPKVGDDPTAIVSGFIRATAAGFVSDFTVAREYLTADARAQWDPFAQVTVFDSGALTPDHNTLASTVSYSVPVAARIDHGGRLTEASTGTQVDLEFAVAQDAEGEWRISALDDGSLLADATFARLFVPVNLVFASQDGEVAVPELRWLPQVNVATWAARELVAGPSPWLADAVRTGFVPGTSLEVDSVVVTDGVAAVAVSPQANATPEDRALAAEQVRLTLTALPGVRNVEVTAGGVPLAADDQGSLSREPVPQSVAAVVAGGRLGLWDGESLRVTADAAGGMPAGSSGMATAFESGQVAFLDGKGDVRTTEVLEGGADALVPFDADVAAPAGDLASRVVIEGEALVAPSFDRFGWVWSAEQHEPEAIVAVKDGGPLSLEVRWLAGREVTSVAVSRDGARVLVVSTSGSQTVAEVAEVVRAGSGEPIGVGEPLQVGVDLGSVVDAVWIDDVSVALLGAAPAEDMPALYLVGVGGRTAADTGVQGAVSIAARHGDRSITLITADGAVRERSGTGWALVVSGVTEFAYGG